MRATVFATRAEAEQAHAAMLRGPWFVTRSSGGVADTDPVDPASIVALALRLKERLIVDAGGVRELGERWGGGFAVEPPSVEIYDDYRE